MSFFLAQSPRCNAVGLFRSFAKGAAVVFIATWLFHFENLADLKFFGEQVLPFGLGFPLRMYFSLFAAEDKLLILPCDQLTNYKLLQTTQNPILFKKCVPNPDKLTVKKDFVTFANSSTNIFPTCGETKVVRHFNYTSLQGDKKDIEEMIPCASSTLQEKIHFFEHHRPLIDGPYSDVNVFHVGPDDTLALETDFKAKNFVPRTFSFRQLAPTVALAHFFGSGTTPVDYFHSHMDRFFSFGIQKTKVWELINPKYHESFDYVWSGNALILTKEKERVPRVVVEQEPGDILFMAPWWFHKTRYSDPSKTLQTKNLNFNLHIMTTRSVAGLGCMVFMNWLKTPTWFYASDTNKRDFETHGLAYQHEASDRGGMNSGSFVELA
ncbi:expressed unknown protein [Seminavis robusta]|uniref:JmjC domain-containing protein n=1 Tax=Seminavis robusta TaxID=568900 RepID=A0A9N8HE39_9STRA|nr:expressed unknown protein [Seminavis robusta]|eukprot:Sro388_g132340.1 n/a (380) ;mRNA; f:34708-35847